MAKNKAKNKTLKQKSKIMKKSTDYKLNLNTGFLHQSTDKTEKTSPDYFGSMDIKGVNYSLGGWNKKGIESGVNYITLNFDIAEMTTDEKVKNRKVLLKDFKADKKTTENKDKFLLIEQTGTLHIQSDAAKKEDFFGKVLINGEMVYINGFMSISKTDKPVLKLTVSEGLKTKDERTKIASSFIG